MFVLKPLPIIIIITLQSAPIHIIMYNNSKTCRSNLLIYLYKSIFSKETRVYNNFELTAKKK